MAKKTQSEATEGTESEAGKARVPWSVKPPTMPPGSESMVKVRSLLGRSSGEDVEMPLSAAQNAVAMGTAQRIPGAYYPPDFPGGAPAVMSTTPDEQLPEDDDEEDFDDDGGDDDEEPEARAKRPARRGRAAARTTRKKK